MMFPKKASQRAHFRLVFFSLHLNIAVSRSRRRSQSVLAFRGVEPLQELLAAFRPNIVQPLKQLANLAAQVSARVVVELRSNVVQRHHTVDVVASYSALVSAGAPARVVSGTPILNCFTLAVSVATNSVR